MQSDGGDGRIYVTWARRKASKRSRRSGQPASTVTATYRARLQTGKQLNAQDLESVCLERHNGMGFPRQDPRQQRLPRTRSIAARIRCDYNALVHEQNRIVDLTILWYIRVCYAADRHVVVRMAISIASLGPRHGIVQGDSAAA